MLMTSTLCDYNQAMLYRYFIVGICVFKCLWRQKVFVMLSVTNLNWLLLYPSHLVVPRLEITMVSALILKVILCQKPARFIFCQRPLALFFTNRSFPGTFSGSDSSLRFLCTKDSDFNSIGRWKDRKYGGQSFKPQSIQHKGEELWDDGVQGRTFSPKSVFAAGAAKRTADKLRRKSPQVSQDEKDQLDQPTDRSRKAGSNLLLTYVASFKA